MKVGVALADVVAGKDAAIAVLAALAALGRGGARDTVSTRRIFISLAQSASAALVNVAQNVLVSGRDAIRWGNSHPNLVPYQLFDAADRPIVVAVGSDPQFRACMLALELPEMADDVALATNAGRLARRDQVVAMMADRLRTRPAAEWLTRLARAAVPAGIVRSVLESLAEAGASPLTGVAPSVPGTVRLPPPALGEHTAAVLDRGWAAFDS